MTLEKAIKMMTIHLAGGNVPHTKELEASFKLGIDALKRCKMLSKYHPSIDWQKLPGETTKD